MPAGSGLNQLGASGYSEGRRQGLVAVRGAVDTVLVERDTAGATQR